MPIQNSVGPGTYAIERADPAIFYRAAEADFSKLSPRKEKLNGDVALGPGSYDFPSTFNQVKMMTIGEKRPQKISNSPGPADYNPDQAISIVKP